MLKKIFIMILSAIIFTAPAYAEEEIWQPEIKLGILSGVNSVELQMSAPCVIIEVNSRKVLQKIPANSKFTIYVDSMKTDSVEIRSEDVFLKDLITVINGKKYFGGVQINKKNNLLTVINLAPVEEYLRGVVPNEMSPSFHAEALKAQTVAARSYTLKNRDRHKSEGYDLCTTNHCQYFAGVDSAKTTTDEIIKNTRGEVLLRNGRIVDTNFHTDSGGMTENVAEVWGSHSPHLQAVAELEKNTYPWTKEFSVEDFSNKIGGIGNLKKINLSPLKVGKSAADRSTSGRVKTAQFVGSNKTLQLTGNELRSKFSLPSTLFDIKLSSGKIIFEGYGYGHGVGMSQNGANAFAKSGWNYEKILLHYYQGTKLKKLY